MSANGGPTITGPQAAMIYLADSLAGFRHAQEETNRLLRELITVAQTAPQQQQSDDDEVDIVDQLKGFITPNAAPK